MASKKLIFMCCSFVSTSEKLKNFQDDKHQKALYTAISSEQKKILEDSGIEKASCYLHVLKALLLSH